MNVKAIVTLEMGVFPTVMLAMVLRTLLQHGSQVVVQRSCNGRVTVV